MSASKFNLKTHGLCSLWNKFFHVVSVKYVWKSGSFSDCKGCKIYWQNNYNSSYWWRIIQAILPSTVPVVCTKTVPHCWFSSTDVLENLHSLTHFLISNETISPNLTLSVSHYGYSTREWVSRKLTLAAMWWWI